jgi:hypothetical protein
VRWGDDDAIGQLLRAAAIVDQDGARDHRGGRHAFVPLHDGLHAVGRQDLERRLLGWSGQGMGIPTQKKGARDGLAVPEVADRLGYTQYVCFGE